MISGLKPKKVLRYLPIDSIGEGCGWITPKYGQEFIGIPYGYCTNDSRPFIEIKRADGVVVETINALDCHAIEFDT